MKTLKMAYRYLFVIGILMYALVWGNTLNVQAAEKKTYKPYYDVTEEKVYGCPEVGELVLPGTVFDGELLAEDVSVQIFSYDTKEEAEQSEKDWVVCRIDEFAKDEKITPEISGIAGDPSEGWIVTSVRYVEETYDDEYEDEYDDEEITVYKYIIIKGYVKKGPEIINPIKVSLNWNEMTAFEIGSKLPDLKKTTVNITGKGIASSCGPSLYLKIKKTHLDKGYISKEDYDYYVTEGKDWVSKYDLTSKYRISKNDEFAIQFDAHAKDGYRFANASWDKDVDISENVEINIKNATLLDAYSYAYMRTGDLANMLVYLGTAEEIDESIGCRHKTKTTKVTKATVSKDGKLVATCKSCKKVVTNKKINKVSSVKLSATEYTYDGKAKKPSVVVKDSQGNKLKANTDYTVKYATGRTKAGKYKVTITLKGNYSGTVTRYFEIIKPKPYLNAASKTIYVGSSFTLKITGTTAKSWKSSNTKVATVSKGKVTAKKAGTATITCKGKDGKSYTCKVTVKNPYLNATTKKIHIGKTYTLKITGTTAKSWKSSNTKVATVSKGKVTAKKAGTATITCTGANGKSYTCKVTVEKHDYTAEIIEPTAESGGYTEYTCTECGKSYKDSYTDPLETGKGPNEMFFEELVIYVFDYAMDELKDDYLVGGGYVNIASGDELHPYSEAVNDYSKESIRHYIYSAESYSSDEPCAMIQIVELNDKTKAEEVAQTFEEWTYYSQHENQYWIYNDGEYLVYCAIPPEVKAVGITLDVVKEYMDAYYNFATN